MKGNKFVQDVAVDDFLKFSVAQQQTYLNKSGQNFRDLVEKQRCSDVSKEVQKVGRRI